MRNRSAIRIAQGALLTIGLLALAYCAMEWAGAKLYQHRQAKRFAQQILSSAGGQTQTEKPAAVIKPPAGAVIGKLEIPRIGVSVMVVEGVDSGELSRAVGHIPGTALPGRAGNIGIAGHRDTFFRPLRSVHRNDAITLRTLTAAYRYQVTATNVVRPEDVSVLGPTGQDTLTLVTCYPFYYLGAAPKRFVVRAERLPAATP